MAQRPTTEPSLPPIATVARSLAAAADAREVMQRVADAAVEVARAGGAYVEQVVSDDGMVEIAAVAGSATPAVGTRVPYPGSLTEEIIEGGLPVFLTELGEIGEGVAPYLGESCSDCSGLVAPLVSGTEILGALVLLRPSGHAHFSDDEVAHVQILSDLASVSLKRLHLLEESRREREERTALLNSTGEGIYGVDRDGRCTFLNRSGARILGYEPEEVLGREMHALIHHSRADGTPYPEEQCPIHRAAREGTGIRVEDEVLWRRDGTSFPAEYGSYPIREQGRIRGAVVTFRDVTDRRAVEDAMRESMQRFRSLAENAAEAIITIDPDDTILYANPAVEAVFGYTADELRDLPFSALMPERFRERHRQGVARHAATGERRIPWDGIELPGLHRDGHEVPLEVTFGEYVRDGRHYYTGIMRDVTERKRADAERERLLERERFLADASTLLASSLDHQVVLEHLARLAVPRFADFCLIDVLQENGRLRRVAAAHGDPEREALLLGIRDYAAERGSGSPALRVLEAREPLLFEEVTEQWREAVAQSPEHLAAMLRLEPRSAILVPLVARGGTLGVLWLVTAESGRRYGPDDLAVAAELGRRASVAVDNALLFQAAQEARGEAERRAREEAALREAIGAVTASASTEEVIRRIAESAVTATNADGAFVERIDIDRGEVVVVATAGDRIPSVGARMPYRNSFAERVVERREPEIIPRLADAGCNLFDDLIQARPDDFALALPLVDGGEPIGGLLLLRGAEKLGFRDDEARRAYTFAVLAALAFRKIHMLEDSEQRREELQRVMESRARLMRGFSHDVKNPLGAADGFLQLLEDGIIGEITPKQRENVGRARRAIGNSLKLIEDLLELARAEAGQVQIEWVPVDVRDAVRELAEEYRAQAEAKGLGMQVHLPDELPVIESDATRLRQILGNLLSNAVKYTDQGGVEVAVARRDGRPIDRPGEWIVAEVRDTGPGIPLDKQGLLFQEFTRLDPGEKKGAGVGLAISQRIAHALNGEITAESEAGRGSRFVLWLPCDRVG